MGNIYKRGNIYWIKYYRNGKPYRETTKSKKEADAKRLLKKREVEISDLTWNQVDHLNGIVRIEPGETRNDEGRTVYLDDELKEVFSHQWKVRKNLSSSMFVVSEFILKNLFLGTSRT